jgi:hypothetical protein
MTTLFFLGSWPLQIILKAQKMTEKLRSFDGGGGGGGANIGTVDHFTLPIH